MKPSDAIQFCLDQFGDQMYSNDRTAIYEALFKAKKHEQIMALCARLFQHASVIINENHPDYKSYKELL